MASDSDTPSPLTALRGIAALLVVFVHIRELFGPFAIDRYTAILLNGYLWVDLFFILSGLVIARVYGPTFGRSCAAVDYYDFLVKRLARIYPLHIATLLPLLGYELYKLGTGAGTMVAFSSNTLGDLLANLALVQTWGLVSSESWNVPSWSISAEWAAYLLFPGLLWVVRWCYRRFGIAAFGIPVVGIFILAGRGDLNVLYGWGGVLRCLLSFSIGVLIQRVRDHDDRLPAGLASDGACFVYALAVAVVFHWDMPDALVIPCFALLCYGVDRNDGTLRRGLEGGSLQFFGRISYSIYLVQWPLLLAAKKAIIKTSPQLVASGPGLLTTLALLGMIVALSAITYRWIERPGRAALRRRLLHLGTGFEPAPSALGSYTVASREAADLRAIMSGSLNQAGGPPLH